MSASDPDIEVEPDQVLEWLGSDGEIQLVDVREPYEREAGYIDGSLYIELAQLSEQASTIDAGRPVVFYCRAGARSLMAAQAFRASGFDAYSMRGGLLVWVDGERPLVPEGGHVAEH